MGNKGVARKWLSGLYNSLLTIFGIPEKKGQENPISLDGSAKE